MALESVIPKNVEDAATLAEELHNKMFSTEGTPSDETPPEPEQKDEEVTPEPETKAADTPAKEEDYEHKYKVLQGKYNAEVPRLATELKEMKRYIAELAEKQASSATPETPAKTADEGFKEMFAEFEEKYTPEFVDTLRKLARYEASLIAKETIKPVEEKAQNVEEQQIEAATYNFKNYLSSKVQGWEDLWEGRDEGFLEFIKQPDPSGLYTYAELLNLYNNNWDADKMAVIFKNYLQTKQPIVPEVPKPPTPNPVKEALIAPSKTTTPSTPTIGDKKIWTQHEIQEFQVNDRQGKYEEDVSKAMWDDLLMAMSEGRIR